MNTRIPSLGNTSFVLGVVGKVTGGVPICKNELEKDGVGNSSVKNKVIVWRQCEKYWKSICILRLCLVDHGFDFHEMQHAEYR
ncbi:hypothetical protein QZN06_09405 [Burkholderia multivorans]|nr:hypothetical protein [Burkholderia multivorans]